MNLTNMLSAWQWAALAAVPPAIIALYFLKLKREPLEVPSTFLWRKSIEDMHVNSLWQRLRKSILLLLQLLLVLLVMLALIRPSFKGGVLTGDRMIFLVDNSASMTSTDVKEGSQETRLDEAKRRVEQMIDAMESGDTAMIISFSDTAQVVQQYSDNHSELRRLLQTIQPTSRPTSLNEAIRVASGLANPGRTGNREEEDLPAAEPLAADLVVLSDFNFPDVDDFALGNLDPKFEMIGDVGATNVGIVVFSTRRDELDLTKLQAFAQLENFGPDDLTVEAVLRLDDEMVDAQEVTVPAGGTKGISFPLQDIDSGVVQLSIDSAEVSDDVFAVDDVAWAVVDLPRRAKVLLVSPGADTSLPSNLPLVRAMATDRVDDLADVHVADPAVLKTEKHRVAVAAGSYDLIIYDQCAPERMPPCNTLFMGSTPPDPRWKVGAEIIAPKTQIIDTERTHPLMQLLDLGNVLIYAAKTLTPPDGGTALIETSGGVVFAIAPRDGFEDAVLGFEFVYQDGEDRFPNTNWTRRRSFPVFVHEVLSYLGSADRGFGMGSVRPGQSVRLRTVSSPDLVKVTAPNGDIIDINRGGEGQYFFTDTEQLGVYQVREQGKLTQRFAVNLFSPSESNIQPQIDKVIRVGNVDVTSTEQWQVARRELWKPLAILGLAVLLFEWYIYNRRVYL